MATVTSGIGVFAGCGRGGLGPAVLPHGRQQWRGRGRSGRRRSRRRSARHEVELHLVEPGRPATSPPAGATPRSRRAEPRGPRRRTRGRPASPGSTGSRGRRAPRIRRGRSGEPRCNRSTAWRTWSVRSAWDGSSRFLTRNGAGDAAGSSRVRPTPASRKRRTTEDLGRSPQARTWTDAPAARESARGGAAGFRPRASAATRHTERGAARNPDASAGNTPAPPGSLRPC